MASNNYFITVVVLRVRSSDKAREQLISAICNVLGLIWEDVKAGWLDGRGWNHLELSFTYTSDSWNLRWTIDQNICMWLFIWAVLDFSQHGSKVAEVGILWSSLQRHMTSLLPYAVGWSGHREFHQGWGRGYPPHCSVGEVSCHIINSMLDGRHCCDYF